MNRLRDNYTTRPDLRAGDLRPANDDAPRSARWLLVMPFVGALCWGAVVWGLMLIWEMI